ncbi:hypothetical protein [Clostridium pasteurianum]|uniref:Transmembrane protein n=1 Tax=Clostridium pasteurianum BC1 TaxID=86416 RepID=R4JYF3_CLOPA|nr:hypothetical protein [Clostridium pasteurianum]AGK95323.1 hypothetical protein Clopa_0259 [Clostridium pasteurianum BC1]
MSQKKKYSRYFIILQEDEKGYGLASDKAPTGYAKLEVRNNKCKVSFYVQNLKKEMKPYYILLICDKKDEKKLVKLGELNIDNTGRAEVSREFTPENIAASGVSVDKISGAAVIRSVDRNVISVLNGFSVTDIPGDWKKYTLIDNVQKRDKEESEIKDTSIDDNKDRSFDEYEKRIEKIKEEDSKEQFEERERYREEMSQNGEEHTDINEPIGIRSSEELDDKEENLQDSNGENSDDIRNFKKHKHWKHESNKDNKANSKIKPIIEKGNKDNKDKKDNKDNKVSQPNKINEPNKASQPNKVSEPNKASQPNKVGEPNKSGQVNKVGESNKISEPNKSSVPNKVNTKIENQGTKGFKVEQKPNNNANKELKYKSNSYKQRLEDIDDTEINNNELGYNINQNEEDNISEERDVLSNNLGSFYNSIVSKDNINLNNNTGVNNNLNNDINSNNYTNVNNNEKIQFDNNQKSNDDPKTKSAKFFQGLTKNLQQWNDDFQDLSKSQWYNIPVKSIEDMYKASSYNRYTILYYPMISYFPYIIRHGHYLFGYKYDKDGKVKYIVYGIPGTKAHYDQPFGGKFGFVSWVQGKNHKGKYGNMGYWLLFYDFRKSVIVIPVNK